tara:strand:+ start:588 stop:1178 length:591 start_codon:yes stop_codon:yes gene_type:complete
MKLLNDIKKLFSGKNSWLFLAVVIVLALALSHYSSNKGLLGENMSGNRQSGGASTPPMMTGPQLAAQQKGNVQPSAPLGTNGGFAQVNGMGGGSNQGIPSSCSPKEMSDPAALLPKDQNNAWSSMNPSGSSQLSGVNLLKAGYHIGIDTVGQSLRNANLQLRSEPANPQLNVGPWNQTTIEPDVMRVPLEVGQGPQ